jgi:hypothetical protein
MLSPVERGASVTLGGSKRASSATSGNGQRKRRGP